MANALELSSCRTTSSSTPFPHAPPSPRPRPTLARFLQPRAKSARHSGSFAKVSDERNRSGSQDGASMSKGGRRGAILLGLGGFLAAGSAWSVALEALPASAAAAGGGAGKVAMEKKEKPRPKFFDLEGSGGVKALDIREGTGASPLSGEKVVIHYYARLLAKQGWRFDSSYDHKDSTGAPEPYVFVIGDGTVIAGLDSAIRTMKEGGVRRIIIPPSQGYQNMMQGPLPPNFSDRQRLFTTIFNPTRLANGEGDTLGALVFDVELLRIRRT